MICCFVDFRLHFIGAFIVALRISKYYIENVQCSKVRLKVVMIPLYMRLHASDMFLISFFQFNELYKFPKNELYIKIASNDWVILFNCWFVNVTITMLRNCCFFGHRTKSFRRYFNMRRCEYILAAASDLKVGPFPLGC